VRTLAFAVLAVLVATSACPSRPVQQPPPPAPVAPPTAPPIFGAQPPGKRVVVLYTASVQGYVEPCGCTHEPLGGVARLAAAVADARRAYGERVLLIDAGDLLFERASDTAAADACQSEARADLLMSTYTRAGLAGTVLGPLDDVRGAAFRDRRLAKHGIVSLGVNPPRALVEGAIAQAGFVRALGTAKMGVTAFRVDGPSDIDPARAALTAEVARQQSAGADAVLVLAQAPLAITRKVVLGIEGIDVVVQGRAPGEVPTAPEQLKLATGAVGPIIVAAGQQAQHLGVLELALDARAAGQALTLDDRLAQQARRARVLDVRIEELKKQVAMTPDAARQQFLSERLVAAESELAIASGVDVTTPLPGPHVIARSLQLARGFPEEPSAQSALAAYTADVPRLVATCEASLVCPEAGPGGKTYVGAVACQRCHGAAHAFWLQQTVQLPAKDSGGNKIVRVSGHARAWETLVADNKASDRTCVGCHSVGFTQPGGACKTTDIVVRGLQGVQCESCHGPGSVHVAQGDKESIHRAVDEALCRTCHRVPHIATTESFVFADRRKLVIGPGHGASPP
jgi:hypothetical protein